MLYTLLWLGAPAIVCQVCEVCEVIEVLKYKKSIKKSILKCDAVLLDNHVL